MISGPLMVKKLASLSLATALGEPGLAGARRAVQQHALGRIDAEPGEQFGIAQRQLDHLAQLADGVAHAADVVVVDVGAAGARFLELSSRSSTSVFSSMWTMPLGMVETTVRRIWVSA